MTDITTKPHKGMGNKLALSAFGLLLIAFFSIGALTIGALIGSIMEDKERGRYLEIAREAARECPAIAGRIPEFAGDGFVTIDELRIVKTLVDNERARPGGLKGCGISISAK